MSDDSKENTGSNANERPNPFANHVPIVPQPQAARDPIRVLMKIATDPDLTDEQKKSLVDIAQARFANRRKMAIWSMIAILASFVFLFVAAVIDATVLCEKSGGILASIRDSENLFIAIEGFLFGIIATYYGASSFRPSS